MLHPSRQRMQVHANGMLLASSTNTLELRERGYPLLHYFLREDVRMDLISVSEPTTYCPFKENTVTFLLGEIQDIAWRYEQPMEGMEVIAGSVAFARYDITVQVADE
ncbi:DUF427 domain-containing protein [Halomonas sp. LS-001]